MSGLTSALESILFVAGDPVPLDRLRVALGCDAETLERGLGELAEQLQERGIRLQRTADTAQLVSASEHAGLVERYLGIQSASRPSAAALEVLAIVAYRQPVARAQIDEIRGVSSDRALRSLLAQNFVQEVGRGSGIGRPALYGTTEEFLQRFGIESLAQLPPLASGDGAATP